MLLGSSQSELRIDLSVDKLTKPYYSTLDQISGRVIFAPQLPVAVNDVIIDFLGFLTTWIDPLTPGAPRRKEVLQFLKMNDDKDVRESKTASRGIPLELPFTFVIPRQLLPTLCKCPNSTQSEQHLQLPPSMGCWNRSDDMSPDMSKIEYQVRVKVVTVVDGKSSIAAETKESVQVMPTYTWWQQRQPHTPSESSPEYERVESPFRLPEESPKTRNVEQEKVLKKGLFGKKRGKVSVDIEATDSYSINVGQSTPTTMSNSLSLPIKMRYSPISADLPPNVSSLSARLYARTKYSVDPSKPQFTATYATSIPILKTSTPSPSTPLWLEDSSTSAISFVSNLLIPMTLPPAAGSSEKKVLLPSFESCLISRSYEIEVKIGFEGGNEVVLKVPISIIAKPATSDDEVAFEQRIKAADDWSPPDDAGTEVEPELLRPTAITLRNNNTESEDSDEVEESDPDSVTAGLNVVRLDGVEEPSDAPPDYELVIAPINKNVVHERVTAVAA